MYEAPPGRQIVFHTRHRKACMEARLVLDSVGVASDLVHHEGWWIITVNDGFAAQATEELEGYHQDNLESAAAKKVRIPVYGGAIAGAIAYVLVLVAFDVLTNTTYSRSAWLMVGQMQSGAVKSGEVWRTVTALTLHAGTGHLISNLAFGTVFGLLAGRILGGGVAWLSIVVAGSLGNLMNAFARDGDHNSIGASTAVFAALGIMVAHALRPRTSQYEKLLKRWSPLIGGVVLLSLTGVGGERTDVLAHGTGFVAGVMIGWIGCRIPDTVLANRRVQVCAGAAAIAIVLFAWAVAIIA